MINTYAGGQTALHLKAVGYSNSPPPASMPGELKSVLDGININKDCVHDIKQKSKIA